MIKERDTTVDYVRCIAMLSIVASHIYQCYFTGGKSNNMFLFFQSYHVPLFFLLSGYVAELTRSRMRDNGFLLFLKRKTETLLVPFLVWSLLVYQFVDNPAPQNFSLTELLAQPDRGAWFLMSLFCIQVVCYPVVRYSKWYWWGAIILILIGSQFLFQSFFYNNIYHYLCFMAGMIIARYRSLVITDIIATLSIVIFVIAEILYPHPILVTITLGVALLYASSYINSESMISKLALQIGQNSLAVYLIHFYFVWYFAEPFINVSGFRATPILFVVVVVSFAVSIICVYVSKIICCFPYLGYILLGKIIK